MSFFLTKKSKHAMKERRKKKLLAEKGLLPRSSTNDTHTKVELQMGPPKMTNGSNNNKRLRSEMTMDESDKIGSKKVAVAANSVQNELPEQPTTTPPLPVDATPQQVTTFAVTSAINSHQATKKNHGITIMIPSNLSTKDVKKFRKDSRRQLRSNGTIQDDSDVIFVMEGSSDQVDSSGKATGPIKKKPKHIYPCINDLVRQQQQQQQQKQDDDARGSTTAGQQLSANGEENQEEVLDESYTSQYVALDCEMVGIGNQGRQSALARVSIVDWHHNVLLDTYVQVPMKVTDYRTAVSGIKPKHIQRHNNAMDVHVCRTTVANIIQNKVLVGHALKNDLHALMLTHPNTHIRDTAKYRPFQRLTMNNHTQKWRPRKLRDLVHEHCQQLQIQQAGQSHNSIEDAIATMKLFQTVHRQWECDIVHQRQQESSSKKKK